MDSRTEVVNRFASTEEVHIRVLARRDTNLRLIKAPVLNSKVRIRKARSFPDKELESPDHILLISKYIVFISIEIRGFLKFLWIENSDESGRF